MVEFKGLKKLERILNYGTFLGPNSTWGIFIKTKILYIIIFYEIVFSFSSRNNIFTFDHRIRNISFPSFSLNLIFYHQNYYVYTYSNNTKFIFFQIISRTWQNIFKTNLEHFNALLAPINSSETSYLVKHSISKSRLNI